MSYKLDGIPSPRASEAEKADFMEVKSLLSVPNEYSVLEASQAMGFVEDEDEVDRISEDLPFFDTLQRMDVRQMQAKDSNYPFEVEGYVVKVKPDIPDYLIQVYTFLLLATRNNMKNNSLVDDLDGTRLFEQLCAAVLRNYFGQTHSQTFVFGTGNEHERSFKAKMELLLNKLKESGYHSFQSDDSTGDEVDDKLDVVAHIPFDDGRKGQFIAFCQCKTGTSWRPLVNQLSPSKFSRSHISPPLNFTPISVFMIAEAVEQNMENISLDMLFFDRCRIMQYLPSEGILAENNLLDDIRAWNEGVLKRYR